MKMKPIDADECVYTRVILEFEVIIARYVDNLLIASPGMSTLKHVNAELSARFRMKDLSEAQMVLGF